jgi:hypothetical protein
LGEKINIEKNKEAPSNISKEAGLEVDGEKTK